MPTMTPVERQEKYRSDQRKRGFSHVRVWIPKAYAGWLHTAAEELRDAALNNETPALPPLAKDMPRHVKTTPSRTD
jgi:hypothetical protein